MSTIKSQFTKTKTHYRRYNRQEASKQVFAMLKEVMEQLGIEEKGLVTSRISLLSSLGIYVYSLVEDNELSERIALSSDQYREALGWGSIVHPPHEVIDGNFFELMKPWFKHVEIESGEYSSIYNFPTITFHVADEITYPTTTIEDWLPNPDAPKKSDTTPEPEPVDKIIEQRVKEQERLDRQYKAKKEAERKRELMSKAREFKQLKAQYDEAKMRNDTMRMNELMDIIKRGKYEQAHEELMMMTAKELGSGLVSVGKTIFNVGRGLFKAITGK